MSRIAHAALLIATTLSPTSGVFAQDAPEALTEADYERAERWLASHANPLVLGASVLPVWLDDGRFWYRNRFEGGTEYVIIDPAAGTRERAFDHARMAAALTAASGEDHTAFALPWGDLAPEAGSVRFEVEVEGETYACGLDADRCEAVPSPEATPVRRFDIVSPGWDEGGLHPRPQPVAPRPGDGGDGATHRGRDRGLRLRDEQCGLGEERPSRAQVVSRLAPHRDLPARRPRSGDDVHGHDRGRAPRTRGVALPAPGGLRHLPDPPRGDRYGGAGGGSGRPSGHAPRPAPLHRVRPRRVPRELLRRRVERRRLEARLRLQFPRPQTGARPQRRREHGRGSRPVRGGRGDVLRVPRQLAPISPKPTRSSGTRSGTTGDTCTSTTRAAGN